jgi:hypothetical protein
VPSLLSPGFGVLVLSHEQRVIPLEEVSAIEKRNSSMVLPNAIQIYTRIAKVRPFYYPNGEFGSF